MNNKVSSEYLPRDNQSKEFESSLQKKSEEFSKAMQLGDWDTADQAQKSYENMLVEMKPLNAQTLEMILKNLDFELIKASESRDANRSEILFGIKDRLLFELNIIKQSDTLNNNLHAN